MPLKVGHAGFKRLEIFRLEVFFFYAAVHLQRANGRDKDDAIRRKAGLSAFNVEEFFGAQVGAEAGFRHYVIGKLERGGRCDDRVATVRDIRKGAAMDERRRAFERLHKVGRNCLLEQRGHRAVRLQIACTYRFAIAGIGDDDVAETLFQVIDILRQAENRHDFGGNRDVKPGFARIAIGNAAERADDLTQRAVVHVQHTTPGDAAGVDPESIAPINVVVDQCGEQIVRGSDGVKVAGKMQIDVFHRHDLRIAATGRTALHAE